MEKVPDTFVIGDRVYYLDNGPECMATVTHVGLRKRRDKFYPIRVEFDDGIENGEYSSGQFAKVL